MSCRITSWSRRPLLWGLALLLAAGGAAVAGEFVSGWPKDAERVWLGPEYWSNPLQDWRVAGGRIECVRSGADRNPL